jgi:hypothetical protein
MTHDEAVNAALTALAEALTDGWPDTDPAAAARFVLQQVRTGQDEALGEVAGKGVTVAGAVLLRLVADAIQGVEREHQVLAAESRANDLFLRLASAMKIMRRPGKPHDKKARLALYELGLVGEIAGQGGERVNHRVIAMQYDLLRRGGYGINAAGALEYIPPHGHLEAAKIIEARHGVDFESLQRQCRRKRIPIRTRSTTYPNR